MVNYNDKIETLKAKGIFSEEQATRLLNSFEKDTAVDVPIKKKRYLDFIGLGLLASILFYIIMAVSVSTINTTVQNVADTLNETEAVATLQSGSSFLMIMLFLMGGLYLVLYIFAHNRFNDLQKVYQEIKVLNASIHNTLLMEKELIPKLETYLAEHMQYKKESKANHLNDFISLHMNDTQSESLWLMEEFTALQMAVKNKRNRLAYLEEACKGKSQVFPGNLAKLVADLPKCQ